MKNTQQKQVKEEKQFNIYKLFTVILAMVLLIVLGILGRNWLVQRNALQEYDKLSETVNRLQNQANDNAITNRDSTQVMEMETESVAETEQSGEDEQTQLGIDVPKKNLDWTQLAEVNPDIYAWICIPGTDVDYPVLQHPTDDSYYLKYNMNGTRGYPGCIYTERLNSKLFTDFNTVVYGHNMRNNSMFATLHYFEDEAFFANCPYIYVYTGDKVLIYEIFAAYTTDNAHILYMNDFSTVEGRAQYLEEITNQKAVTGNIRPGVICSADSRILTLSTCVKGKSKNRFLVQAVLLNEDEL